MTKARTRPRAHRPWQPGTIQRAQALLDSYERLWRARIERLDALLADDASKGLAMPITSVTKDPET